MPPRTEQDLLDQTIQLAMLNRWAVVHQRPARTHTGWRTTIQGHAGFVDLVLARDGLVLFRELKGDKGRIRAEQLDWARQLMPEWRESRDLDPVARMGWRYDLWRPADFEPLIMPTLMAPRLRRTA